MAGQGLLTYSDLEDFPDDGLRRELIGGELYVTPSPSPKHQRAVLRIALELSAYAARAGGEAFVAPLDVVLNSRDVVEPDVIYIDAGRVEIVGGKALTGPPALLVEVLSASTGSVDRGAKRDLYARAGVPEYWIVDLDARSIERHANPRNGTFDDVGVFNDRMPAATLPDLTVSVRDLIA